MDINSVELLRRIRAEKAGIEAAHNALSGSFSSGVLKGIKYVELIIKAMQNEYNNDITGRFNGK